MGAQHSLQPQHLNLLAAFACVAEVGSFSQAARVMGLTQPAISQQVRRLESAVGARLFQRGSKGVVLTEAGQVLYGAVASGLADIQRAVGQIHHQQSEQSVCVATDFGFAALWLTPRLHRFRAAHPQVALRLITAQRSFDLHSEQVDLWVRCGPSQVLHTLSTPLLPERVMAVASPALLEGLNLAGAEIDFQRLPLLSLHGDREGRWYDWASWLQQALGRTPALQAPLQFDNYSLVVQAAISGQGVALGWLPLIQPLLQQGTLVPLLPHTLSSDRGYHVTLAAEKSLCDAAWRFYQWLLDEVQTPEASAPQPSE